MQLRYLCRNLRDQLIGQLILKIDLNMLILLHNG
nr:MAG TPA: biofilm formation regulatory protein [Bacteriophage sp.]